ncbi:MAG: NTP transferase domain-containing protein [Clostridia bacterium]|nr:NTP transferase domain-containing protein [Clostridia bacterium]
MNNAERFDSVILAGGFGKRMMPLTASIPKPMLPVAGEPAFARILALLRKNGFRSTAVTTMYLPESIEDFKCDQRHAGRTEFFRESGSSPLGSAGSVFAIGRERFGDSFCVISGDAVCNFKLREYFEEFEKGAADAAMLLHRSADAGEYGTVCVKNGAVTGFCEKPSVRDTLSDLINTGIYFFKAERFFSLCERTGARDFGKDVFPEMLRAGMTVAGIVPDGEWFDIGSFYEYHRCNMYLSGGENVFGRHVSVHPEAAVEKSVLFDGATVGKSTVSGSIIGGNAWIGNGCIIPPGCVIGGKAEIRDGAALAPGSVVGNGETVSASPGGYFKTPGNGLEFFDDHIKIDVGDRGAAAVFGSIAGGKYCGVVAQSEAEEVIAAEIAAGCAGSGADVAMITGFAPAGAAFCARSFGFDRTVHVCSNAGVTEIRLFGRDGMAISREETRKLSRAGRAERKGGGRITVIPRTAAVKRYIFELRAATGAGKQTAISFAENENDPFPAECASELGVKGSEKEVFEVSPDGTSVKATLADGREISYWHLVAVCCILMNKSRVYLPNDTPLYAERMLDSRGIRPVFYSDSESAERSLAANDRFVRDGTLLAFSVAELLRQNGQTLAEAAESLAPFSVLTRSLYAEKDRLTAMISELRREYGGDRCVGFDIGDGHISVFPSASGAFRIIAEAFDSETAEEISLRAIEMIEKKENN